MSNQQPLPTSGSSQTTTQPSNTIDLKTLQKSKEARELVAWCNQVYSEMKGVRSRAVLQWNLNLAFYYGKQYLEIAPPYLGGRLFLPKAPPYRVRLVSNRIRPVIRTEIAKMTSQQPTASVVPTSSDDEDLFAAYAGEQIWESISGRLKYKSEFMKAVFWMAITGTGFLKIYWDPNKRDEQGNQGDIDFGCVTPYHLLVPNLREESIEGQPYVCNVYTRTCGELELIYKDIKDFNIHSDVVASQEIMSDAVLNLSGAAKSEPDSVLVKEFFLKPGAHKLLPDGGMITVINDTIVYMSNGLPYTHGMYPFAKFEHIPSGTFYKTSTIEDLMSLQREYNRTRSQITEAKNRTSKPGYLYAKGSVDPSKITTEPGQWIPFMPGLPAPQPIPLQPLPNYVLQEQDRIINDMEDISGQHQVSRGETPPGVTAATAISYLQEKDDSLLYTTFVSIEAGIETAARQALLLAKQFWDYNRTVAVTGTDGYFDVLQLKGSQINSDIHIEGGSALPTSKAAKQAFIMDLMKMGFVQAQDGLKLMDMGGVQQLYRQLKVDESQAQRENIKMKRIDPGQLQQMQQQYQQQTQMMQMQSGSPIDPQTQQPVMPPPPPLAVGVNDWDNHAIHVQVHNQFRKGQAFELLAPEVKDQFAQHVQAHMQAIAQAQQQAAQISGGPQMGGPSGPGPGSMPPGQGGPLPTTSVDNAGLAIPPTMNGQFS